MDYAMNHDPHYNPRWSQQQQQHQSQNQQQQQQQQNYPQFGFQQPNSIHRASSSLSLNLSSLTVASPTNLSPIGPPSGALSPVTPISPANYGNHLHPFQFGGSAGGNDSQDSYDPDASYDSVTVPVPHSPRSTTSTLPRKRSFSSDPPPNAPGSRSHTPSLSTPSLRITTDSDTLSPRPASPVSANPTSAGYDEIDMGLVPYDASSSPVDGSSGSGDDTKIAVPTLVPTMGILGKPMATNNFVTKLYQMITDAKSSHFIAWTELGTSFVVNNVGEFSRSILGSHFKHNNFSSFVRQLNMYGFHKINRTPRAQRTTSDAQTWEFSHHKFLRGRPDLLDEIKRKALEPDPALKHRVELPGEVAAQLGAMRDENQRMWEQLNSERRRVEKLVAVVNHLWDVVSKGFPGSVPPFPVDLLEPNIFITSPRGYEASSTAPVDFTHHPAAPPQQHHHPAHGHSHSHSLSRQHSFQHISFSRGETSASPLPASPGSITMEMFDDGESGRGSSKRQRMMSSDDHPHSASGGSPHPHHASSVDSLSPPKPRTSRARSDSAPLGYAMQPGGANGGGGGLGPWGAGAGGGRPRSGSGIAHIGQGQRGIPNIGNMSRGVGPNGGGPLLSLTTVPSNAPSR
ncbi:HSF-type DNA-binding-domain-containing protein [Mycena belliarum]|uniref:HSF-type DNA-binding-domain-containing protein n=1 Tax=Mycena belliarum TaxID=1033014 RepID=A0AAD6U598_9AGAR|nr:HSF-type DNA-binding-domain-containing protein [Mycena belliae]